MCINLAWREKEGEEPHKELASVGGMGEGQRKRRWGGVVMGCVRTRKDDRAFKKGLVIQTLERGAWSVKGRSSTRGSGGSVDKRKVAARTGRVSKDPGEKETRFQEERDHNIEGTNLLACDSPIGLRNS